MTGRPYFHRFLEKKLLPSRLKKKVILLFGARQTGKTTLLRHLVDSAETLFINLQDRQLRRRYESDPSLLVRELSAETKARTIIIDEIQKIPELMDDVQLLYDRDPDGFQFILTGSSARRLKHGIANLLPGRSVQYTLSPVIQAEQRRVELLPLDLAEENRFPLRELESYLLYGNLPGFYSEGLDSWEQTLAAYADLYIENEVRQENIVKDMGAFNRFLEIAALESGQLINYAKMASTVGVSVNTLRNFYQVLEDSFIGMRIQPFSETRRRIVSAPRFIFCDIGIRHALANLRISRDLLRMNGGPLFKQWVIAELFYRCGYHGPGFGISTWRTSTGAEVDLILQTPDEIIPVEIKWSENPRPSDARHVEKFIELDQRAKRGYVICRSPNRQKLSDRVTALPWNEF